MSPFLFKVIFQLFYVTDLYEFIYFLIFYCLEKIQVPYHKDLNFQLFSQKIFNVIRTSLSPAIFPLSDIELFTLVGRSTLRFSISNMRLVAEHVSQSI